MLAKRANAPMSIGATLWICAIGPGFSPAFHPVEQTRALVQRFWTPVFRSGIRHNILDFSVRNIVTLTVLIARCVGPAIFARLIGRFRGDLTALNLGELKLG